MAGVVETHGMSKNGRLTDEPVQHLQIPLTPEVCAELMKYASPLARQMFADAMIQKAVSDNQLDEFIEDACRDAITEKVNADLKGKDFKKATEAVVQSIISDPQSATSEIRGILLSTTGDAIRSKIAGMNIDVLQIIRDSGKEIGTIAEEVYQQEMAKRMGPIMDNIFATEGAQIREVCRIHVENMIREEMGAPVVA